MHPGTIRYAVLVVALTLAGPAWGQDAVTVPAPEPKPFEQVVYRLSTDDSVACKAAGAPESIIEAMMKTGGTGGNR